jgi:hypothetical protein
MLNSIVSAAQIEELPIAKEMLNPNALRRKIFLVVDNNPTIKPDL